MNVGLREAHDLANILADRLPEDALRNRLDTYNSRWHNEWQRLLGLDGGLQPTGNTDPWVRQHAGQLLSCLPASGDELPRLAGQLGLEASCLSVSQ